MAIYWRGLSIMLIMALVACKNPSAEKTKPITPAETRSTMEYNQNRIDTIPQKENTSSKTFKGSGGEPFWSVAINAENIHFETANSAQKAIDLPTPKPEVAGNTTTFQATSDKSTIKVAITEEKCTGMNGKAMTHSVKVSVKTGAEDFTTYKGCGSYSEE